MLKYKSAEISIEVTDHQIIMGISELMYVEEDN